MFRRSDQVNQCGRSVGCKRLSVSHGAAAIVQRQIAKKQKQPVRARDAFEGSEGPKKRSVAQSPGREEGGWRLRMEGKRSKEPMGAERAKAQCEVDVLCG
jgi:hypothetical protein